MSPPPSAHTHTHTRLRAPATPTRPVPHPITTMPSNCIIAHTTGIVALCNDRNDAENKIVPSVQTMFISITNLTWRHRANQLPKRRLNPASFRRFDKSSVKKFKAFY